MTTFIALIYSIIDFRYNVVAVSHDESHTLNLDLFTFSLFLLFTHMFLFN
jgi:hypothetical protein